MNNNKSLSLVKKSKKSIRCLCIPILLSSAHVYALDVEPGDYAPMPDGSKLGLLYYQTVKRDSIYADGRKVSSNSKLDSQVAILRLVRFQRVKDYLTNIQVLLPVARFSTGGDISELGNRTGFGDPILASAFFINKDGTADHSYGITQYLTLPIGSYDSKRSLNIGENRWQYVFQAGYNGSLTDKIKYDLTGDVTLFGSNKKYTEQKLTLKQEPKYQLQGYLRYKLNPKSEIYAGYSRSWKGETKVDNVWQDDVSNQSKFMLGTSYFLTARTQILGTLGGDLSVDNGFKEKNSLKVRLLHVF